MYQWLKSLRGLAALLAIMKALQQSVQLHATTALLAATKVMPMALFGALKAHATLKALKSLRHEVPIQQAVPPKRPHAAPPSQQAAAKM